VDVFSAGLLAFEIWTAPFATQMGRVAALADARAGVFPEGTHPHVVALVRWLAAPQPCRRPSARAAGSAVERWLEAGYAAALAQAQGPGGAGGGPEPPPAD